MSAVHGPAESMPRLTPVLRRWSAVLGRLAAAVLASATFVVVQGPAAVRADDDRPSMGRIDGMRFGLTPGHIDDEKREGATATWLAAWFSVLDEWWPVPDTCGMVFRAGACSGTWELFDVVTNPMAGDLDYDSARTTSSCTLGDGQLSIDHARFSFRVATVDVTFRYSFLAPPGEVRPGDTVELPIELTVEGTHDSENAGAIAGFAGYGAALSVAACSLTQCGGSPDASPQQSGTAGIRFPGPPSDPSTTFEFEAFLSDSSPIGGNCRVRYIYAYAP